MAFYAFLGCSFANAPETEWRSMAQSSQNCLGFPSTTTPCLWVPLPWFPCANPCAWRRKYAAWFALASDCLISYHIYIYTYLVGGLEHLLFFHILGIITPTDFHILNRGVGIPTTGYMISIPLLELQAKTGILKPTKLGRWPNSLRREDKPWIFYGRGEVKAVQVAFIYIKYKYIYIYKYVYI